MAKAFLFLLIASCCWLLLAGASAVSTQDNGEPRFAAMETPAPVLGILMPRAYYAVPAHPMVEKRQGGVCPNAGSHPCNELGSVGEGYCCLDNAYCIVNTTHPFKAACCRVGSTCDSPCPATAFLCNTTITTTVSGTRTTLPSSACCPRRCPQTSAYGCPSDLGGGCCPHGFACGVNSACLSTVAPSTSPRLTPVPSGCTSGQITCPVTLGGGCCPDTAFCTTITSGSSSGSAACAPTTFIPTGSGFFQDPPASNDLSAGAKAGIAVGVVVFAGIAIGTITWFCLRRTRKRREAASTAPDSAYLPRPAAGRSGGSGGIIGRIIGSNRPSAAPANDEQQSDLVESPNMQYIPPVSHSAATTPGIDQQLAQQYIQYQQQYGQHDMSGGLRIAPPPRSNTTDTVIAVPLQPNNPEDFQQAVEIDGRLRRGDSVASPRRGVPRGVGSVTESEAEADSSQRFELAGSNPVSPQLSSPDWERGTFLVPPTPGGETLGYSGEEHVGYTTGHAGGYTGQSGQGGGYGHGQR